LHGAEKRNKVYFGLYAVHKAKENKRPNLSSIIATERIDLRRARSLRQHQRVGGTSQFTDQMHRSDSYRSSSLTAEQHTPTTHTDRKRDGVQQQGQIWSRQRNQTCTGAKQILLFLFRLRSLQVFSSDVFK
jgi:hypothetical protein